MKNKKILLGVLVLTLVFGMTVIGCEDGSDSGGGDKEEKVNLPSTTGTFTFTDIPTKYNGKFVVLEGYIQNDKRAMIGFKSATTNTSNPNYYSTLTGVKIVNGSVTIPLYTYYPSSPVSTIQAYSGNDFLYVDILVYNSETLSASNLNNVVEVAIFGTDNGKQPLTFPVQFNSGSVTKSNNEAETKLSSD